jgi:hypothetical protein
VTERFTPHAHGSPGSDKLRRRIAEVAARLVEEGQDVARARIRAARGLSREWVPEDQLPAAAEIRRAIDPVGGHLGDRFDRITETMRLLAAVRHHPAVAAAGDGLEHALIVFTHVFAHRPYDEELLTAALVQHAGLVFDRNDPVHAGLETLGEAITPRTAWILEHLPAAHAHVAGSLGIRARKRLEKNPDFLECLMIAEADRPTAAAEAAAELISLEKAIEILRGLENAADADADLETERQHRPPPEP